MYLKELSYTELVQYCLDNGLDILEVDVNSEIIDDSKSSKTKNKKIKPKAKKPSKEKKSKTKKNETEKAKVSTKNPRDIIVQSLAEFRDRKISLDEFVYELENKGLTLPDDINCPLAGFVSDVLYEHAEALKFAGITNSSKRSRKRILNPVNVLDLKGILKIDFGDDAEHIVGIIGRNYFAKNYPLNKSGKDHDDSYFTIEGTRYWGGEGKQKTRKLFIDFVNRYLVSNINDMIELQATDLEGQLSSINSRIKQVLSQEVGRFVINAPSSQALATFKKYFIEENLGYGKESQRIKGMHFDSEDNSIIFEDFESKDNFFKALNHFRDNRRSHNDILRKVDVRKDQNFSPIKVVYLKDNSDEIKEEIRKLRSGEILPSLNYLGLEGPGFASYLLLHDLLSSNKVNLRSFTPEYNYRLFNLMNSMAKANPEKFRDAHIERGNIDDLILLDFARNQSTLLQRGNSSNSNGNRALEIVYDNKNYYVCYDEERISLHHYENLVKELRKGLKARALTRKYPVSEEFINVIDGMHEKGDERRFDIVFLDYLGPYQNTPDRKQGDDDNDHKKARILKSLTRKLADRAVVAHTFNLASWKNLGRSEEQIFEKINANNEEIFRKEGYEVVANNTELYQDNVEPMLFTIYYLEKKD